MEDSTKISDMRIMIGDKNTEKYNNIVETRDIILIPNFICEENDYSLYEKIIQEIETIGIENIWKLWHNDTHFIADDNAVWKNKCPTFNMIINKLQSYFDIDIKQTRLNWYKDSSDWKPNHHDKVAIGDRNLKKPITVSISLGATRDVIFEHSITKTTVLFPITNGSVYCFSKDVNIEWLHGIPKSNKEDNKNGRISIIIWGWVQQI